MSSWRADRLLDGMFFTAVGCFTSKNRFGTEYLRVLGSESQTRKPVTALQPQIPLHTTLICVFSVGRTRGGSWAPELWDLVALIWRGPHLFTGIRPGGPSLSRPRPAAAKTCQRRHQRQTHTELLAPKWAPRGPAGLLMIQLQNLPHWEIHIWTRTRTEAHQTRFVFFFFFSEEFIDSKCWSPTRSLPSNPHLSLSPAPPSMRLSSAFFYQ